MQEVIGSTPIFSTENKKGSYDSGRNCLFCFTAVGQATEARAITWGSFVERCSIFQGIFIFDRPLASSPNERIITITAFRA
jgi:hypothetical protein